MCEAPVVGAEAPMKSGMVGFGVCSSREWGCGTVPAVGSVFVVLGLDRDGGHS